MGENNGPSVKPGEIRRCQTTVSKEKNRPSRGDDRPLSNREKGGEKKKRQIKRSKKKNNYGEGKRGQIADPYEKKKGNGRRKKTGATGRCSRTVESAKKSALELSQGGGVAMPEGGLAGQIKGGLRYIKLGLQEKKGGENWLGGPVEKKWGKTLFAEMKSVPGGAKGSGGPNREKDKKFPEEKKGEVSLGNAGCKGN